MKTILTLTSVLILTSCVTSQLDRMEWLGKEPPMSKMMDKTPKEVSAPMNWPKYDDAKDRLEYVAANSLWDKKDKTFFKDNRASQVGDILTIKVSIDDKAELDNKTQRKRQDSDTGGITNLYGFEEVVRDLVPGNPNPASLINRTGNMNNLGEGNIDRKEVIQLDVAAVVTNVMENGNLVIYGSQEVRVNYEVRQLTVQGVIRPEDVSAKNDISYNQIAEARISYGGKGIIMDIQQPRIGNQLADIVSPF